MMPQPTQLDVAELSKPDILRGRLGAGFRR